MLDDIVPVVDDFRRQNKVLEGRSIQAESDANDLQEALKNYATSVKYSIANKPSDTERSTWADATKEYVESLEHVIEVILQTGQILHDKEMNDDR